LEPTISATLEGPPITTDNSVIGIIIGFAVVGEVVSRLGRIGVVAPKRPSTSRAPDHNMRRP
jgi:hypothetical protein